jgi:hypothetical protein
MEGLLALGLAVGGGATVLDSVLEVEIGDEIRALPDFRLVQLAEVLERG